MGSSCFPHLFSAGKRGRVDQCSCSGQPVQIGQTASELVGAQYVRDKGPHWSCFLAIMLVFTGHQLQGPVISGRPDQLRFSRICNSSISPFHSML
ncbi:hypothetical protein M5689_004633 [Euphorbia peplus]|nr:hypothetical protein M5689_004633 [Euphorbia peplus]